MSATENLAGSIELALDVGIGEDGPFPAVVICGEESASGGSMRGYVHRYGPVAHGWYLPAAILTRPTEPDWQGERIAPDESGRYAIGSYGWCWYEWDEGTVRE